MKNTLEIIDERAVHEIDEFVIKPHCNPFRTNIQQEPANGRKAHSSNGGQDKGAVIYGQAN